MEQERQTYVDVDERDRTITVERKGKGKERARCSDAATMHSTAAGCVRVDVHERGAATGKKVGVGFGLTSWIVRRER
jgi:hypothetical protein